MASIDANDPEPGYDLGFMETFLLIMVVQRRHQEDPAAFAILTLGKLKPAHLHNYRQVLYQKHAA
jgi:hypothetical protein